MKKKSQNFEFLSNYDFLAFCGVFDTTNPLLYHCVVTQSCVNATLKLLMHTTLRVAKAREEASANCRKEDLRRFTTIEGDSRVSVSQDKT